MNQILQALKQEFKIEAHIRSNDHIMINLPAKTVYIFNKGTFVKVIDYYTCAESTYDCANPNDFDKLLANLTLLLK